MQSMEVLYLNHLLEVKCAQLRKTKFHSGISKLTSFTYLVQRLFQGSI